MRVVVVGAGAWGLPAGAELARRGHQVVVLDALGVGSPLASSAGDTRIWRLTHPHAHGVRLALRSVAAWRRLERRSGRSILMMRGLLWRGPEAAAVSTALATEGVAATEVAAADVAQFFPTLRASDLDAVWQQDAGPLRAAEALAAAAHVLGTHGGEVRVGRWVERIDVEPDGVRAVLRPADDSRTEVGSSTRQDGVDADVVVLAPGPWAPRLLESVGIEVPLTPVVEQVSYFHGPGDWPSWPCLVDSEGTGIGVYAMPAPGLGYKLGNDRPLRVLSEGDNDRTPSAATTSDIERIVAQTLPGLNARAVSSQVCTWTDSPDGWFVVDRVQDGRVVVAYGDSGQGFKFSALMGEVLADLAEGAKVDRDVAALSAGRFSEPVV